MDIKNYINSLISTNKQDFVNKVFNSVHIKYDLMNDIMSFGMHRIWKHFMIMNSEIMPDDIVLDIATGSGDIAFLIMKIISKSGYLYINDINLNMLLKTRKLMENSGYINNVSYILANAEALPFNNNYIDCITISFGLRNINNIQESLNSMYRILKLGGKVIILEFSNIESLIFNKIYNWYLFNIIPKIGGLILNDELSYYYLAESISLHPKKEIISSMLRKSGFKNVKYYNLMNGMVVLHKGYKI